VNAFWKLKRCRRELRLHTIDSENGVTSEWLARYCFATLPLLICFLLTSCARPSRNAGVAQQAVEQFHSQLNSEQYSAIYSNADESFKNATSASDFAGLLRAIHQKLGTVSSSSLRSTSSTWSSGEGSTVTLLYSTLFSHGSGTEQFIWHMGENRATLYGYHITSADLIAQ
jgi:hypothetical protein